MTSTLLPPGLAVSALGGPALPAELKLGPRPMGWKPHAPTYCEVSRYLGCVCVIRLLNTSSDPSWMSGTEGSGSSHPNEDTSPEYWIWMVAVTTPFSIVNRSRSPACTTGTVGSGG